MTAVYFPLEMITALLVYVVRLERREHFCRRLAESVLLAILVIFVWYSVNVFYFGGSLEHAVGSLAAEEFVSKYFWGMTAGIFVLAYVNMAILISIPFRLSFREVLYCTTCAYLTEHIAYCIRLIVNGISGRETAGAGTFLYFLIHAAVYLAAYFIFAKQMIREQHYATSAFQSVGLMLCALFLVIGMSLLASTYDFEILHGIYAIFCCVFVLYSQLKQQEQLNLQQELGMQKELWVRSKAQYEMSKETIAIINSKCHDLKHQVAALRTIESPERRDRVLDSLEKSAMIYDSMLKTGNRILDTVLTEKSLICNQNGITLTCIADGKLLDFMDAVDIYTLFGNALDNAIESVKCLKKEERFIHLQVQEKLGLILIQIENRYNGTIQMKDGFPVTTKEDKDYHGFGVRSIVRVAEIYHGFGTIETENQMFLLRLTIPQPVRITT